MFTLGGFIDFVIGAGASWAICYWYFHRDKIRVKIAAEVNRVTNKVLSGADKLAGKV
jgi:transcription initiation factor IIE alpha subunit